MKIIFLALALLGLLFPSGVAAAPCGEAERERPGNDDVFILIDSSLSMGPTSFGLYAHGYMEPVKHVLLHLVNCYFKPGDFVLIGTFDSEARIEVAKEIRVPVRDLATLREEIAALGPSRPRYWDRRAPGIRGPERDRGTPATHIAGGSLRTDLGEMLALTKRALERYSSSGNRQLVLLFTDGEHDPPEYSQYLNQEIRLEDFLPQLGGERHKLGLVILPDGRGTTDKSRILQLIKAWDPDEKLRNGGSFRSITPDARDLRKTLVNPIIDMLNARIDLVGPEVIELGDQVKPRIQETLRIHNQTKIPRTVKLKSAFFESDSGKRRPLQVSPAELVIKPGETVPLSISGRLHGLPKRPYTGRVKFEVDGAISFAPREVRVHGRKVSFLEAYWWAVVLFFALLVAGGLLGLYLLRKRVWMALLWTKGTESHISVTPKPISIGQTLKFGGWGTGGLEVEGPDSRIGEIVRKTVKGFELVFDYRYLSGQSSFTKGEATPLAMGMWYDVPGSKGERISFRQAYTKKRLLRLIRSTPPASGGELPGSGLEVAASSATNSLGF